MTMEKPKVRHYSKLRTSRGNVQIGRLAMKTNVRIEKDLKATSNLFKGKKIAKKFKAAGRLALRREAKKLKA